MNPDAKGLLHAQSPFFPSLPTFNVFTSIFLANGPRPDTTYDRHLYIDGIFGVGYTFLPQWKVSIGTHGYMKYLERTPHYHYRKDVRIAEVPELILGVKAGFPIKTGKYSWACGFTTWFNQWISIFARDSFPSVIAEEFKSPVKAHGLDLGMTGLLGFKSPFGTADKSWRYFEFRL